MANLTLRQTLRRYLPQWLLDRIGKTAAYSFLYGPALVLDAIMAFAIEGFAARLPGVGTPTALPLIGRDRQIRRGFAESEASYAVRLREWRSPGHKIRGSPLSVMQQLRGYLTPHNPMIRVVNRAGAWHTLDAAGEYSYVAPQSPRNWDWDAQTIAEAWSEFWVIIYPPLGLWTRGPTWGDPTLWGGAWGTPGYTWGSTATPDQVADVRAIVRDWQAQGSRCVNVIIAFDYQSFDPNAPAGAPLPDGTWGLPGVGGIGTNTFSRLDTAIYWDGT